MKKTTKKNTNIAGPSPAQVDRYRTYPAIDVDNDIRALADFLTHRTLFETLGKATLMAAAERAYWADALSLAAHAASSSDQARRKVQALQPALDGRWQTADEHHAALVMIRLAVEVERGRWGLAAPTRH